MEDGVAERRLLCAVIEQAYVDATGQGGRKAIMREAIEWLNSERNDPFSYLWTCEQLQIDPSVIRGVVKSVAQNNLALNHSRRRFIPTSDSQRWGDRFGDLGQCASRSNGA